MLGDVTAVLSIVLGSGTGAVSRARNSSQALAISSCTDSTIASESISAKARRKLDLEGEWNRATGDAGKGEKTVGIRARVVSEGHA